MKRVLRSIIVVLFASGSAVSLSSCVAMGAAWDNVRTWWAPPPPPPPVVAEPEPMTVPRCDFAALPGREFRFPFSETRLGEYGYVLWRLQPSLLAEPLTMLYAGRRGKLTGEFVYSQGERWFEAQLEDCRWVYAMDTSREIGNDPIEHLEAVGRIYFIDQLRFARALAGAKVRVHGAGLEPRQRLYTADSSVAYPLRDGDLLEVVGVETFRYGHTKGIGGFYLALRSAPDRVGLVKFHPNYLRLPDGTPLWPPRPEPSPLSVTAPDLSAPPDPAFAAPEPSAPVAEARPHTPEPPVQNP